MKLTNCLCGQYIDCACGTLSFDSYLSPSNSVLNVGNLVSSSGCVLEEYVIDWYRDGVHALVTGKGLDPDIDAFHPMTGSGAVPVMDGLYTAEVRYIVVNGVQRFLKPVKCKTWCNTPVDLPAITVNSIYCGLKGTGDNAPAYNYDFRVSYTSTQDYNLATRSLRFFLTADSLFFAFSFAASNVADRITIYHSNDLNNPLTDWIVGGELPNSQYDVMPFNHDSTSLKVLMELPAFTENSYLLIHIIPSVYSGQVYTDWTLDMKCLITSNIDYNVLAGLPNPYVVESFNLVRNDAECRFELYMDFVNAMKASLNVWSDTIWYGGATSGANYAFPINISNTVSVSQNSTGSLYGATTKTQSAGNITVSKVGSVYTMVCDSQSDYDKLKAGWLHTTDPANSWWTGFVNDPADLNYYRQWRSMIYNSPIACGQDGEVGYYYYWFREWEFIWDDVNRKLTINTFTITNGYVPATCASGMDYFVNDINSMVTRADFSYTTRCSWQYIFGYTTFYRLYIPSLVWGTRMRYHHLADTPHSLPNIDLYAGQKYLNQSSGIGIPFGITVMEYAFKYYITAQRDTTTGEWITEPADNFEIYWTLDPATGVYNPNSNLWPIYRKENGIVTLSVPFATLYNL